MFFFYPLFFWVGRNTVIALSHATAPSCFSGFFGGEGWVGLGWGIEVMGR